MTELIQILEKHSIRIQPLENKIILIRTENWKHSIRHIISAQTNSNNILMNPTHKDNQNRVIVRATLRIPSRFYKSGGENRPTCNWKLHRKEAHLRHALWTSNRMCVFPVLGNEIRSHITVREHGRRPHDARPPSSSAAAATHEASESPGAGVRRARVRGSTQPRWSPKTTSVRLHQVCRHFHR